MDRLVSILVGLGTPGLVVLILVATSGLAGAAAMTSTLAILGGPFGMLGGILMLPVLALVSSKISEYGIDAIFEKVVRGLYTQKNLTKSEIIITIEKYPISKELKEKLKEYLEKLG